MKMNQKQWQCSARIERANHFREQASKCEEIGSRTVEGILLFYSALHLVEAYFVAAGIKNARNHTEREIKMSSRVEFLEEDNKGRSVLSVYKLLYDLGWDCRYVPHYAPYPTELSDAREHYTYLHSRILSLAKNIK